MKNTLQPALSPADQAWLSRTLERNHRLFGGWTMEDTGGAGGDAGGADSGADGGAGGDTGGQGGSDKGYPASTPVADMTAEQQAAYWRDKAQLHEGRNKDLLRITGNKYGDALKADLEELNKLRTQGLTDAERAVEDAKSQTRTELLKEFGTKLAAAEFRAALAHVDGERREQIIEGLNLSAYLTDSGDVDTDKVQKYATTIAPAAKDTGNGADYGAGKRRGSSNASGVAAGAEMFAATRKKSTTS